MILTIGSRGDVQPYVALGAGLRQAGHNVTLCTAELFSQMVVANGVTFAPLDDEMIRLTGSPEARKLMEGGGNMLKAIKLVRPMIGRMVQDAWTAARDVRPDLIIYHPKTLSGYHIAEKLAVPVILSLVLPTHTPTREFPLPLLTLDLGRRLNKLSYKLMPLVSAPYAGVINDFRRDLGLPTVGHFFNETRLPGGAAMPTMYGYSQQLVPRPADWPQTAVVTGYWFLDSGQGWTPPVDLVNFLQAGPPPVYIGFGSMAGSQPERVASVAIGALQKSGQRGILATGWGGLAAGDLPQSMYKINTAPHDWLFPKVAAVVHHGGSGTTAAGLRAGRPTMICPFFGDQPFWGQRVYRLGAGPEPVKQKKLTVDNLAAAIDTMLNTAAIRQTASQIGEKLRAEDGIANAVRFVEAVARD